MVREVEMLFDWFGSVFIVDLNISKLFTQSAARFADVYFFAPGTGNTVEEIDGNTSEMIGDGSSSLRSGNLFVMEMKGQVLHHTRTHLNVSGWWSDLSVLLTRKLLMFLSRLYEMRNGCEKISAGVGSFWSFLDDVSYWNVYYSLLCDNCGAGCGWTDCARCLLLWITGSG